ncbi:MAG: hypothetical protein IJ400_03705 [Clostridia bacterium]|nr:hypothetical protein [Clostridia bacterium]
MENNTKPTNEKSLLKLLQKLKSTGLTVSNFGKKKIFPLIAAGSIAFILTSCNVNEIQTDIGSSTNSAWTDSSSTTDSSLSTDIGSNGTDTSGGNLTEDKLSKYSPLVQEMLTEEYYTNLLVRAQQDPSLYSSPYFDPHPYTFLEEQGHDIEKVKAGEYECRTQSFIKKDEDEKNNLYIATYIENAGGYYTEYMLKYSLTDEEMENYNYFHRGKYFQAVFLNDWISANKSCTIVSKVNVDIETHKGLELRIRVEDSVEQTLQSKAEQLFLIFNSFDAETRYFNVYAMKYVGDTHNMTTGINVANIPLFAWMDYDFDNNMILFYSYDRGNYGIREATEIDTTSVYYCQSTDLSSESTNAKNALD